MIPGSAQIVRMRPKGSKARDWWPINEEAGLVKECALRFGGGKLEKELTPAGEQVQAYPKLGELRKRSMTDPFTSWTM
ncbi:hypothetical protein SAMN02745166_01524 [Prosthecobacter debontii]|uniref:Uncharacterized protein n=1 Tax=Prosthecobacter debontii TaxID=48467 RepID=A0A1T4XHK0_9BACT|nr:hypothetical protein SAMN02745166_01524 [Prosthecobacter debontii]